jgi:type I restriction enzyme, S subunit
LTQVALGETARFVNGAAFKPDDWSSEGLPIIRIQNLTGTGDSFNFTQRLVKSELVVEPGDLLVSWSATLDAYRWAGPRGLLNQHIFKVLPKPGVDPDYLYYALKSSLAELSAKTHGSTMKHVVRGDFESTQIRLPAFEEQRRIVDLLARAEGIVRLRREAHQKAAELIPAIFIDMFGDPAMNPNELPLRSVRELVARFEGGKNLQAGSDGGTDFRILKVSAVTSGEYVETESKPTPNGYEPPQNHVVREGDMLFSRANTEELVGATAVVRETNGRTLLPDKLWRFVWAETVEQAFMLALFQSSHVRQALGVLSSGTSASMRNISQAKLFELRLPIPSLREQRVFARRAQAAQSIRSQQEVALAKATATFDALLSRAFG